jgi:hypothetical protein
MLGNIYLHYVLDVWFERDVKPRMRGASALIRYADDFIIGFEREDDAVRVERALRKRMEKHKLTLHAEKTRLFPFAPPSGGGNRGSATFDFLGFTAYWQRTRRGRWRVAFKTRRARLRRSLRAVADWCRRHRHWPVEAQHRTLVRKLKGHFAYFAVNGNQRSLAQLVHKTEAIWRRWLDRRSQRARMNWRRFKEVLAKYPLPGPRVQVKIWG